MAEAVTSGAVLQRGHFFIRDAGNPVLPPVAENAFDCGCCMNPWVLRRDDEYWLYYGGGDREGHRRICLAIAKVGDLKHWRREGPVLDLGAPGSFDAHWNVLPHVIEAAPGRWHLYYTSNQGHGRGLSSFPGLGLALSADGRHFTRYRTESILPASGVTGAPDAIGMAGGSVLKVALPGGGSEWRFYYTGCPTIGDDVFLNQQKTCCLAVSADGIHWERRGAVMRRDPERDTEDIAVAGPVVRQLADGSFRMWYSAIGTRWGYYSIGYAESADGLTWQRGTAYDDNLVLGPTGDGWERQMVEYPSVIEEDGRVRLFYCGNGYGGTGIGTALASSLRAYPVQGGMAALAIVAEATAARWSLRIPEGLSCDEGVFKVHNHPPIHWHGPDARGRLWSEWTTNDADFARIADPALAWLDLKFIQGLQYRVLVDHGLDGLVLTAAVVNHSSETFHNVTFNPCLAALTPDFQDPELTRSYITDECGLVPLAACPRGTVDAQRTHFLVSGQQPIRYCGPAFWGQLAPFTAARPAILRTSADGQWTIVLAWERAAELWYNNDDHQCLHAVGSFGDLAPGETKALRGRLLLVRGPAKAALAQATAGW